MCIVVLKLDVKISTIIWRNVMSGDRDVAGDDGYDEYGDRCDYESEGGADDSYNDEHDGDSYSKDDFGGAVIFWIFCFVATVISRLLPPK
jgi:hypothetical protein